MVIYIFLSLGSNLDGNVYIKFKRPIIDSDVNEFIPSNTGCTVNSFFYKNILTLLKINVNQDWTNSLNDLEYDVQVDWQSYKPSSNNNIYQNAGINNHGYSGASNYSNRKSLI
jgi:hypothetical protein